MRAPLFAALLALLVGGSASAGPALQFAREDPTKIVGSKKCAECHDASYQVWLESKHSKLYTDLHRKDRADEIAKKLGFKRGLKRDTLCLNCHFTPVVKGTKLSAVAGVSCESCHGAAADWINVHNDYGGKDKNYRNEDPVHRERRISESRRLGMRRPSDLYPVAANCFGCHVVPNEELVNVAGHKAGTAGFELVERTQGIIRHNFLQSMRTGDGTHNVKRPPEWLRLMYLAGRSMDLEHSLRGLAQATQPGKYLRNMQRRVKDALAEIEDAADATELPELQAMVSAIDGVPREPGAASVIKGAAAQIGAANRRLLRRYTGGELVALDPLVSGGDESAPEDALEMAADDPADFQREPGAAGGDAARTTAGSGTGGTGSATRPKAKAKPGRVRTRIRPADPNKTVSGSACSGCHDDANEWWVEHPHYASADPFFDQGQENLRIARRYGIKPRDMARGTAVCMDCHGTIVSGKERRDVSDGVSCQSCHGAAGKFLDPHQDEADPYPLGMVRMSDLNTRAKRCTDCHYITDARLLAAGHTTGKDFDYAEGMVSIQHWKGQVETATAIRAAFAPLLAERSVPKVERIADAPGAADAPRSSAGGSNASSPMRPTTATGPRSQRPMSPPPVRPIGPVPIASFTPVELSPLSDIEEDASVEDTLERLAERVRELHHATGSAR